MFNKCVKPMDMGKIKYLPPHFKTALSELGTAEIEGKYHNPRIQRMFDLVVGQKFSDETPWCAAFVGYCLESNKIPSTNRLNARSYLKFGKSVDYHDLQVGDIVVFYRGTRKGWKGHVAFFSEFDGPNHLIVLGGNQKNTVCYQRYPKSMILGTRAVNV